MERIQLPGDRLIEIYQEAITMREECLADSSTNTQVTELAALAVQIMELEHPWLKDFCQRS